MVSLMIATWASAILLQEVLRENCFYVMSCIIHDQIFYCLIPEVFATWWCEPLIFLTLSIWYRKNPIKYQRSTTTC